MPWGQDQPSVAVPAEGGWGKDRITVPRRGGAAGGPSTPGSSVNNPVGVGVAVPVNGFGRGPDGSISQRTANGWRVVQPPPVRPRPPAPPKPNAEPSGRLPRLTAQGTQDTLATGIGLITNPYAAGAMVMRGIAGGADWIGQHIDDPTDISGRTASFLNKQADSYGPTAADRARRLFFNEAAPTNATERLAYGAGAALPGLALGPGAVIPTALSAGGGYAAGEATRLIPGSSDQDAEMASTVGSIVAPGLAVGIPRLRGAVSPQPIDLPAATARALEALPQGARDLPAPAMAQLQADLRAGMRPEDAAVRAVNSTLAEPIPMSRGQTSGLPDQQAMENAMRAGAMGRTPAEIARAQATEAQGAITTNLNQIGEGVVGGPVPPRGAGAATASETLNGMYDQQRAETNSAYDAARNAPEASAMFPAAERTMLEANLRTALSGFREQRVPAVFAEINRIRGLEQVTPADLFDVREALTNLRNSGDGTEGVAASRAVRALDNEITRMEPMMQGDTGSIDLWRRAIAQRRQQGRVFESNDAVAGLTERMMRSGEPQRVVAPEDAGNRLFGTGNSWVNKPNLARDLAAMREALGPQSAEWNALRGEHFRRIMDAGRGPLEAGADTFSGRNFANAWRDARRNAMPTLRELYSPGEIAAMDRLAFLADRTTSPVTGGKNYSNSATTAKILTTGKIGSVLRVIPGAEALIDLVRNTQRTGEARRAFIDPQPNRGGAPRVPRRPMAPLTRQDALALTGPGLIGAGNRQGE